MKVLILSALLLSASLTAAPLDEVKKSFEGSHIQKNDWVSVQQADYQQAGNADKYRILNVKLGSKEGMVKVDFTNIEDDHVSAAESYCWKLAGLTPLIFPETWSDTTPDQSALSLAYIGPLENGATRKAVIKGWTFIRYRMENTIYCSAKEGA
jgi:hypothetical protein